MNPGGLSCKWHCILLHFDESWRGQALFLIGSWWLKSIIRLPEGVNQNLLFCAGGVSLYYIGIAQLHFFFFQTDLPTLNFCLVCPWNNYCSWSGLIIVYVCDMIEYWVIPHQKNSDTYSVALSVSRLGGRMFSHLVGMCINKCLLYIISQGLINLAAIEY